MAIQDIYQAVLSYDHIGIVDLVGQEVEAGTDISVILNSGLIAAMDEVGARFERGDIFVPHMLVAGRAMRAGLEVLRPYMTKGDATSKGTVVFGTVKGDIHDIGKNLVILMLEGAGFKVVDLGVDVDNDVLLSALIENRADVLALSALLTSTMVSMERTVAFVKKELPTVKIVVGGAPVTDFFAQSIGADGYAADAPSAVPLVRSLLERAQC
jgi:5-methyltetrahydrofolate--homocysteine methyltransferase